MDYAHAADDQLVDLIVHRDERALEQIYDRYARATYSLVLRMLRDPGLAEEVSQEVFLKLWRRPASYVKARGSFGTWLLSVAHHRAIDELRARRFETSGLDDSEAGGIQIADDSEDLAELAWMRERRGVIRSALTTLPDPQRHAIELAYYGGLTQREIADRLSEPLGTIKTRMRLGMRKLRDGLSAVAAVDGRHNGHTNGKVAALVELPVRREVGNAEV